MGVCDLMKQVVEFGGEEGLSPREGGEIPLSNTQKEEAKMGLKKNVGWKIGRGHISFFLIEDNCERRGIQNVEPEIWSSRWSLCGMEKVTVQRHINELLTGQLISVKIRDINLWWHKFPACCDFFCRTQQL